MCVCIECMYMYTCCVYRFTELRASRGYCNVICNISLRLYNRILRAPFNRRVESMRLLMISRHVFLYFLCREPNQTTKPMRVLSVTFGLSVFVEIVCSVVWNGFCSIFVDGTVYGFLLSRAPDRDFGSDVELSFEWSGFGG